MTICYHLATGKIYWGLAWNLHEKSTEFMMRVSKLVTKSHPHESFSPLHCFSVGSCALLGCIISFWLIKDNYAGSDWVVKLLSQYWWLIMMFCHESVFSSLCFMKFKLFMLFCESDSPVPNHWIYVRKGTAAEWHLSLWQAASVLSGKVYVQTASEVGMTACTTKASLFFFFFLFVMYPNSMIKTYY